MRCIDAALGLAIGFWTASSLADVTLRGRVISKTGTPVAGAHVYCLKPGPINSYPGCVETTTNAEGTFEQTIAGPETPADLKSESVLVYAEGHGLGVTTVGMLLTSPGIVTLPEPTGLSFGVLDPQGRVAAGELVEPVNYLYGTGASSNYGTGLKLPGTLMQVVGRVTDDAGIVGFPALSSDKLRTIQVVSENYGVQELGWPAGIRTVRLRATAGVEVEFDRPGGLTISSGRIVAYTGSFDGPFAPGPGGPGAERPASRPTTGVHIESYDHPRGIKIPAIAEGTLGFRLTTDASEEPVLPRWPGITRLKAGTVEKIVVPLEPTVTIRGRVVERQTNRPVPNVTVVIGAPANGNLIATRTDDAGRYRCKVLKGKVSVSATQGSASDLVYGGNSRTTQADVQKEDSELPDVIFAPTPAASR